MKKHKNKYKNELIQQVHKLRSDLANINNNIKIQVSTKTNMAKMLCDMTSLSDRTEKLLLLEVFELNTLIHKATIDLESTKKDIAKYFVKIDSIKRFYNKKRHNMKHAYRG